jgi:hypothetical protein
VVVSWGSSIDIADLFGRNVAQLVQVFGDGSTLEPALRWSCRRPRQHLRSRNLDMITGGIRGWQPNGHDIRKPISTRPHVQAKVRDHCA